MLTQIWNIVIARSGSDEAIYKKEIGLLRYARNDVKI